MRGQTKLNSPLIVAFRPTYHFHPYIKHSLGILIFFPNFLTSNFFVFFLNFLTYQCFPFNPFCFSCLRRGKPLLRAICTALQGCSNSCLSIVYQHIITNLQPGLPIWGTQSHSSTCVYTVLSLYHARLRGMTRRTSEVQVIYSLPRTSAVDRIVARK